MAMTEHLSEKAIEAYRGREGTPADRQKTAAHLAVCDDCRERVLNSEHSVVAFNSLTEALLPSADEEPFHLSLAEMKSYVAGAAATADRIICESHIDDCERCNQELRILSAAHQRGAAQAASSSRKRFARPSQSWGSFTPARVAAVIALCTLLVLAFLLWRRLSSRDEFAGGGPTKAPIVSVSPTPNEATPQPTTEPNTANSSAVVSIKDNGREIRLDQQGELTGLGDLDEWSQKAVQGALAGETLAKPKVLDDLSSPNIKLLGEPSNENLLALISPLSIVLTEERPTLRWKALSGATSYVVSVFDENFNRVAQSPPRSNPNWTIAEPLQRGRIYSWEVTAVREGKEVTAPAAPAPRAQFKVLEAEKLNALTKLKQRKPVSHLALGLMYARIGLTAEAAGEFRVVVKENPDSAVAKKLLRTVQAWLKSPTNFTLPLPPN